MKTTQSGAVLLSVLVLMMILAFMLLSLSSVLDSRLAIAQESSQLLEDKAAAYAKLQELTYLVATQRVTRAGVSRGMNAAGLARDEGQWKSQITGDEVRFDGYLYKDGEKLTYSLQNEAGLIPINNPNQLWLKRWLSAYGNDFSAMNQLADALYDYADADRFEKPAGAEASSYQNEGLPIPRNFLLQSCSELNAVMGWKSLLTQHPEMLSQCSLSRLSYLNINAIPVSMWRKIWPNSSELLIEMRNAGNWFSLPEDILSIEPSMIAMPDVYYTVLGGDNILAHVKQGQAQYSYRIQIGQDKQPPFFLRATPKTETHQ